MRGSRSAAAPAFSELPPPDGVEALYYEGMAAYQHRHWEEALDRFTRLKELQPTRPGLDALLEEVRWFLQLQAAAPANGGVVPDTETKRRRGAAGWPRPRAGRGCTSRWQSWPLQDSCWSLSATGCRGAATGRRRSFTIAGRRGWPSGTTKARWRPSKRCSKWLPAIPRRSSDWSARNASRRLLKGYAAAEAAIAEENWDRAGTELAAILQVDPNFPDARARADFVEQRRRLAMLYADGGRLYDLGQWAAALAQFEKVRDIDAGYRSRDG